MKQNLLGVEDPGRESVPFAFLDVALCIGLLGQPQQSTRLSGLNDRNLLSHNSGVQKSKIKASAGFCFCFFLRPLSMTCHWSCSLRIVTWSPSCVFVLVSSSYMDTSLVRATCNDLVLP